MFVEFVIKYWLGIFIPYLAVAIWITRRFREQTKAYRWYNYLVYQSPAAASFVVRLTVLLFHFILVIATLPVMWFYLDRKERREKERCDQAEEQRWKEEAYREIQRKGAENERRRKARGVWLAENRPKLYYRSVSGITAVLLPDAYVTTLGKTTIDRRNGFWESELTLCPAPKTVVFVTKKGKDLMTQNLESEGEANDKIAGWLSDLDAIVEQGNIELIHSEEIFVPWVNESLATFANQRQIIQNCRGEASFFNLIEKQTPRDLQPIH